MSSKTLNWTVIGTPIKDLVVLTTASGIARIAWDQPNPGVFAASEAERLSLDIASYEGSELLTLAASQLQAWFEGELQSFDLPLSPDPRAGATFSSRVLSATSQIPRGQTLTYGQIAALAGNSAGARAAGNALGANPIPIIIPCHRIVAANGLGGFGGGSERKRLLLEIEGVNVPPS